MIGLSSHSVKKLGAVSGNTGFVGSFPRAKMFSSCADSKHLRKPWEMQTAAREQVEKK